MRWRTLSLLAVVVCSVFIAGAFDVLFPDVIPIRPYTSFFATVLDNPRGSSLEPVLNGLNILMIIIPVVAILVLAVFPVHAGLSLPPLILGPHGKSDTSHSKWHDKMAKKSVAKRILKRIREKERMNNNLDRKPSA